MMTIKVLLIRVPLLLLLFPFSSQAAETLDEGDAYYASFNNELALAKYEYAYKIDSTSFQTLVRMTRIYNDMGRIHLHNDKSAEVHYGKSLVYAESLVRRFPQSAIAHFWFALAKGSMIPYVAIKEKIEIGHALQRHAQESLRIDSTLSYPYILLAVFEREAGKLSWLERGIARIVFGEDISGSPQTAEIYLQKAIRLEPGNSAAFFELGWTYLAMDDRLRAKEAFDHVLKIKPQNLREFTQFRETEEQMTNLR